MYSARNKNKDRFRTQTYKDTLDQTPTPSERPNHQFHSPPVHLTSTSRLTQEPSSNIIKNLQKHIQYLQKKLKDSQVQIQNLANNNEWLNTQMIQKTNTCQKYWSRMQQQDRKTKQILIKYENLQTDIENFKLQQKVEKLNREINDEKDIQLRTDSFYKTKKDKFSSAFLPTPFGSPEHYKERSSELYESVLKEPLNQSSYICRGPFEQSLWSEWKKLKHQKAKKEKEIATLKVQNQEQKKQIQKIQKQFQKLRLQFEQRELKNTTEVSKLKTRIINYIKDQKLLMNKLKSNQERMSQLSLTLKGQNDGERFFAHSSSLELQQIFEKISHNLQFESATIDITIDQNTKTDRWSQTHDFQQQSTSIINQLNMKIRKLQEELVLQQKSWAHRLDESNYRNSAELKDASDMMDLYKCRIQHLTKVISDYQRDRDSEYQPQLSERKNTKDIEVSCDIISGEGWTQHQQILQKIRILIDVNQQQLSKIHQLQSSNEQLNKQLQDLHCKEEQVKQKLLESTEYNQQQQVENQCQNCHKMKKIVSTIQIKQRELVCTVGQRQQESNHFKNAYQDTLTKLQNLENQTKSQINKLKIQSAEKENSSQGLFQELSQKNEEIFRCKQEIIELKTIISRLQQQIELINQKANHQSDL